MADPTEQDDPNRCTTRPHAAHDDCPGSTRAIHGAKLAAQLAAIRSAPTTRRPRP